MEFTTEIIPIDGGDVTVHAFKRDGSSVWEFKILGGTQHGRLIQEWEDMDNTYVSRTDALAAAAKWIKRTLH